MMWMKGEGLTSTSYTLTTADLANYDPTVDTMYFGVVPYVVYKDDRKGCMNQSRAEMTTSRTLVKTAQQTELTSYFSVGATTAEIVAGVSEGKLIHPAQTVTMNKKITGESDETFYTSYASQRHLKSEGFANTVSLLKSLNQWIYQSNSVDGRPFTLSGSANTETNVPIETVCRGNERSNALQVFFMSANKPPCTKYAPLYDGRVVQQLLQISSAGHRKPVDMYRNNERITSYSSFRDYMFTFRYIINVGDAGWGGTTPTASQVGQGTYNNFSFIKFNSYQPDTFTTKPKGDWYVTVADSVGLDRSGAYPVFCSKALIDYYTGTGLGSLKNLCTRATYCYDVALPTRYGAMMWNSTVDGYVVGTKALTTAASWMTYGDTPSVNWLLPGVEQPDPSVQHFAPGVPAIAGEVIDGYLNPLDLIKEHGAKITLTPNTSRPYGSTTPTYYYLQYAVGSGSYQNFPTSYGWREADLNTATEFTIPASFINTLGTGAVLRVQGVAFCRDEDDSGTIVSYKSAAAVVTFGAVQENTIFFLSENAAAFRPVLPYARTSPTDSTFKQVLPTEVFKLE
jgi:hypothetical protein